MKEKKNTLRDSLRLWEKWNLNDNKTELARYQHLKDIKNAMVWKDKDFYKGLKKDFRERCIVLDFYGFIYHVYRKTRSWYDQVENILEMSQGEERFLKYGRVNCSHLLDIKEEDDRDKIVKEAEKKGVSASFFKIKDDLFPIVKSKDDDEKDKAEENENTHEDIDYQKDIDSILKKKYEDLKKQNESLRKENERLKKRIVELELTIRTMNEVLTNDKQNTN